MKGIIIFDGMGFPYLSVKERKQLIDRNPNKNYIIVPYLNEQDVEQAIEKELEWQNWKNGIMSSSTQKPSASHLKVA